MVLKKEFMTTGLDSDRGPDAVVREASSRALGTKKAPRPPYIHTHTHTHTHTDVLLRRKPLGETAMAHCHESPLSETFYLKPRRSVRGELSSLHSALTPAWIVLSSHRVPSYRDKGQPASMLWGRQKAREPGGPQRAALGWLRCGAQELVEENQSVARYLWFDR